MWLKEPKLVKHGQFRCFKYFFSFFKGIFLSVVLFVDPKFWLAGTNLLLSRAPNHYFGLFIPFAIQGGSFLFIVDSRSPFWNQESHLLFKLEVLSTYANARLSTLFVFVCSFPDTS